MTGGLIPGYFDPSNSSAPSVRFAHGLIALNDLPRAGDVAGDLRRPGLQVDLAAAGDAQVRGVGRGHGGAAGAGDVGLGAVGSQLAEIGVAVAGDVQLHVVGLALGDDVAAAADRDFQLVLVEAVDAEVAGAVDAEMAHLGGAHGPLDRPVDVGVVGKPQARAVHHHLVDRVLRAGDHQLARPGGLGELHVGRDVDLQPVAAAPGDLLGGRGAGIVVALDMADPFHAAAVAPVVDAHRPVLRPVV